MADEPRPIDEIIGEGRDAGPGAKPEAEPQQQPSASEQAGVTPPRETEERPGLWAYSALQDERAKRQAFQDQARALQEERDALLAAQQRAQQPQQHSAEADSEEEQAFWANPSAFITNKLKMQEANFSFRLAHERHQEDFERAYGGMLQLAHAGDPSVVRWCMASPDPGDALMRWYAQATQQQGQASGRPVMPSNLTGARNVGSRRGPAWSGPTPLDDIFDRSRR